MSKQISLVFDVGQRLLIGASSNPDEPGFSVMVVPEDKHIVVSCEGSFSWRVVSSVEQPIPEQQPVSEEAK